MTAQDTVTARIDRLHGPGLVDMHFDLLMDLYEKRSRPDVIRTDFLPDFQAGDIGLLGAAIFISDRYLPEMGLRVALDQISRLYAELDQNDHLAMCRTYAEIRQAQQASQIAVVITMEGVEPLNGDIELLRVFYELGVRSLGLTHARRNRAGDGGLFASSGSSPAGLSTFGRQVIERCEALGIIVDLAHLNPAGFDDVLEMVSRPVIISHTNPRHFYDIERNSSDAQIKRIGECGGVVGIGALLLSPHQDEITLDNFADQIAYVADLIGIDGVGLGFDFFKFLYDAVPEVERARWPEVHFIPEFTTHAHTRRLTRKLIERGFADEEIEKILYGNFMRIFEAWLQGK